MWRMNFQKCINNRKIILSALMIFNIIFFLFIGMKGPVECNDTGAYFADRLEQGLTPLYPFFIKVCKAIAREKVYWLIMGLQTLLAVICDTAYILFLRKKFNLYEWELAILWVATIMPYMAGLTNEGKQFVMNHAILTEGLAYPLFLLWFMLILQALWKQSKRWYFFLVLYTFVMSAIRPQLLLLFAIDSLVLLYRLFILNSWRRVVKIFAAVMGSMTTVFVGVWGTFYLRGAYVDYIEPLFLEEDVMENSETDVEEEEAGQNNLYQVAGALAIRGVFEMDADDYQMFDAEWRDVIKEIYEKCYEEGYTYAQADNSWTGWKTLKHDEINAVFNTYMMEYVRQAWPEYGLLQQQQIVSRIKLEVSLKIIGKHWTRFGYHCLVQIIPSYIRSVFFVNAKIYVPCLIFSIMAYGSIILMWIYLQKTQLNRACAIYIMASLVDCIAFVSVISIVFITSNRYYSYNITPFWCAYYIAFRTIVIDIKQKREKKKKDGETSISYNSCIQ